ncbi:YceI family protein [Brevundimonas sp.]|uniref:YceI family protein n=1 Tax=Brevundimonas sp. TaxID=1871086 RepID=UPI002D694D3F|nr:YceI family protein [Brevundimonas sp.]HYC68030.1 YceI family protein [Brevundimonas sp.]
MRRRALLIGVLAFGLAGAAPTPWVVIRDASSIELTVRALGVPHRGQFEDWRGDITFDPAAPGRTRATVVVQAASLRMGSGSLTRRATGPGMLDSASHPVIRFDLRSLESVSADRYSARADITMKGRTRPVSFPLDLRVTGDRAHLTGAFTLDRTEFGIGTAGAWNRMVGREVTVRVSLQARRA